MRSGILLKSLNFAFFPVQAASLPGGTRSNWERARVLAVRCWASGVCAALLILGCPLRGKSQTRVATVGAGNDPTTVAVNPVTNKIYVANFNSANVTVIDGATNATTTVGAGTNPVAAAVNPVTNK